MAINYDNTPAFTGYEDQAREPLVNPRGMVSMVSGDKENVIVLPLPAGTPQTLQQAVPALTSATQNLLDTLDALHQTAGNDYQTWENAHESALQIKDALKQNAEGNPAALRSIMEQETDGHWFAKTEGTGYSYNYADGPISTAIESIGTMVDKIEDDSYIGMNKSLRAARNNLSAARDTYTSGFSQDFYFDRQPAPSAQPGNSPSILRP